MLSQMGDRAVFVVMIKLFHFSQICHIPKASAAQMIKL